MCPKSHNNELRLINPLKKCQMSADIIRNLSSLSSSVLHYVMLPLMLFTKALWLPKSVLYFLIL